MVTEKVDTNQKNTLPWKDYQHSIEGEWLDSTSDERLTTVNPATEEPLGTIPLGTVKDVGDLSAANAVAGAKPNDQTVT